MQRKLLVNARVYTMDSSVPRATAIAVHGASISAVGDGAQIKRSMPPGTEIHDLGGRTVVPGFIDAHTHFAPMMLEPHSVDLCGVPDIPTLQRRIRDAAALTPPGAWIRAWGYHERVLREQRHPTRGELDEAAPEHLVFAVHASYHRGVAGTHALQAAGLVRGHTYMPNGHVDCDAAGDPIGVVAEAATNALQHLSIEDILGRHRDLVMALLRHNAARYLSRGITAVHDAWVSPTFHRIYREAAEGGHLALYLSPLRGSAIGLFGTPAPWLDGPAFDEDLPPRLRAGGIKIFADGAGLTAAVRGPAHAGCAGGSDEGLLFYPQSELNHLVERAGHRGCVIAIHAIGERGIALALAAFTHARRSMDTAGARARIEHFHWSTKEDIDALRTLGAGVVLQPVGIHQSGDGLIAMRRPSHLRNYPIAELRASGVPVAGSSDAPCFHLPPLWGMAAAVGRVTRSGALLDGSQRIDSLEALRMYTSSAAWAGGTEAVEGSITAGKLANLVVLDRDPIDCRPEEISKIEVDETWVDGVVAFRRLTDPTPRRT